MMHLSAQIIIVVLGIISIYLYYKTVRFTSFSGILLFIISFAILGLRIYLIKVPQNPFYNAGSIVEALCLSIFLSGVGIAYAFLANGRLGVSYSPKYIIVLLPLYFLFGLFQQVMFQFVFFETIFTLVGSGLLAVLISGVFFSMFHLNYGKKFIIESFVMGLFCSFSYWRFGNILTLAIFHGIMGTIFAVRIMDWNALEQRLGISLK